MPRSDNLYQLPENLPVPHDDGACDHLAGKTLPSIKLLSTSGSWVDLSTLAVWTVVYCYPRTGLPSTDPPPGWDGIPGARGCTPQSCAFRDVYKEFQSIGAVVFGLSTQDTAYQQEAAARLHLPFDLLSDESRSFSNALRLPTFEIAGMVLIRRLTLILLDGSIEKVIYPVFPPDENAAQVLDWLSKRTR